MDVPYGGVFMSYPYYNGSDGINAIINSGIVALNLSGSQTSWQNQIAIGSGAFLSILGGGTLDKRRDNSYIENNGNVEIIDGTRLYLHTDIVLTGTGILTLGNVTSTGTISGSSTPIIP